MIDCLMNADQYEAAKAELNRLTLISPGAMSPQTKARIQILREQIAEYEDF